MSSIKFNLFIWMLCIRYLSAVRIHTSLSSHTNNDDNLNHIDTVNTTARYVACSTGLDYIRCCIVNDFEMEFNWFCIWNLFRIQFMFDHSEVLNINIYSSCFVLYFENYLKLPIQLLLIKNLLLFNLKLEQYYITCLCAFNSKLLKCSVVWFRTMRLLLIVFALILTKWNQANSLVSKFILEVI